jgi:hypothetical protein
MQYDLSELIASSHSPGAGEVYRKFSPNEEQRKALAEIGRDVLLHFPPMPAACAFMSAFYAARVQMSTDAPVYVVAGALSVGTTRIFGEHESSRDWAASFNESNLSWDGHCWITFGPLIADVSIFRTAYSENSPPALARYVRESFGTRRGLLICTHAESERLGFHYEPQYVLTEKQITGLIRGAEPFFN